MLRPASRRAVVAAAVVSPFAVRLARAQDAAPAPSDNAAIARAFYEPFNTGDTSVYDTILAEDWRVRATSSVR